MNHHIVSLQFAVDEANRRNLSSLWIPEIDPVNPCLILIISRENIVADTINQIVKQKLHDFKKPLKVCNNIEPYSW